MRMPPEINVKNNELDIKPEAIRLKGKAINFDEVDKIVAALVDGRCFTKVEKGKARKLKEGVEFQISMNIDCEANPGKPLPKREAATVRLNPKKPAQSVKDLSKPVPGPSPGLKGRPAVRPKLPTPALGIPEKKGRR